MLTHWGQYIRRPPATSNIGDGFTMKRTSSVTIAIVTALILSVLAVTSVSCQQQSSSSEMTATEVCRYTNQVLPDEYVYLQVDQRYEYRYSALFAQRLSESTWQISVKVVTECQQLYEGQWTIYPGSSPQTSIAQYVLNEASGSLTKQ